jgi:hypothetical protein
MMKTRFLYILLIISGLIACQEEKKKKAVVEPPKIIPTVTPIELHGAWIKSAYVEDLMNTKSPLKSFKMLTGIALFSFDTARLKDSILRGGISWNGHEGGACTATFKSGKTPRSILLNVEGDTVKTPQELVLANNELLLMSYPSNGSAIAEKYVRASEKSTNIDTALGNPARRIVFAGKWQLKESKKDIKKDTTYRVELSEEGLIKGSPTYTKYDVIADYGAEPLPYDQVLLFADKIKKPRILQFKRLGDTLKLTERIKKKEVLVFQLVKMKK